MGSVEGRLRDLASRFTGTAVALSIYLVILFHGVRIMQTVGEERAAAWSRQPRGRGSRVVEMLLATIGPAQLLTGKVIGYGVLEFSPMLAAAAAFYPALGFMSWTAPIAMPTLFAVGAAPAWQVLVSALGVMATLATARLAGLIYQRAVLRTGARVRIREVLRYDAA